MSKKQPLTLAEFDTETIEAAKEFLARQDRTSHPEGYFDNANRWEPSKDEECWCCGMGRTPSRAFPFSKMQHCRTAKHVSKLLNVDELELKRAAKLLKAGE